MYNSYITSAALTLRTKGSPFSDYSNLLTDSFDNNPFSPKCCSCSNCCCCCASSSSSSSFVTHRLHVNYPSLFYGLRQSTLIQLSPWKRLIFGGRDRYYCRVPDYELDHGCFEVSCSFKKKGSGERIGRRRKGRFGGLDLHERRCLSNADDVDAVINLLSEEVREEYLGERDQNGSFSKRVEMEKSRGYRVKGQKRRVQNARLGLLECESKNQFELDAGEFRKGDRRWRAEREEYQREEEREDCKREEDSKEREEKEERKTVLRGENCRDSKASSSFSSYYSLSSSGDLESDNEAQDKHDGSLEESSSGYQKELLSGENTFDRQVLEQRNSTARANADWDLRKKTEKKLTEIEEMQSINESSQLQSGISRTSKGEYGKVSSSHKQIGKEYEKSTLAVHFEEGKRKQYNQTGVQVSEQSQFKRDYQEITGTQEIQLRNGKSGSQNQRQFNGRKENLTADVDVVEERRTGYHKTVSESVGKGNSKTNVLQLSEVSEVGNADIGRVTNLQRNSESRMKIHEEDRAQMSVLGTSENRQETYQQVTGQLDYRRDSQQLSEISEVHKNKSRKKCILQSETGTKYKEGSVGDSYLVKQAIDQKSDRDQNAVQKIQSRKGSHDVTNISVNVTNISVQGSDRERERYHQTDERIAEVKSRNETHKTTAVSSFPEKTSQGASSSQTSLKMVSQARIQQSNVEEANYWSSDAMTMPPSRQVVDRGSLRVNPTSETATGEVIGQTSESSSSALYENWGGNSSTSLQEPYDREEKGEIHGEPLKPLAPEDAMGSAYRQEESSIQFVGEFVETASHEVLSSEILRDKNINETLVEGKDKRKNLSQYSSGELKLTDRDSRQSSQGSGGKGPSDEMWDTTDPSIQEPPEAEAQEGTKEISTTVVRRTGRSLWSIIADIVQLRWGSCAETPKSARRSGGKSSPNQSASSEAWFSGHDPEENSDKNVGTERSMRKEAASSHHLQLKKTSSRGREELSDTTGSKSKIRELEVDTPSSSTILKSGSTSKGISSPSEEEIPVWGLDGKSSEGTQGQYSKSSNIFSASTEVGKSSSPPPPSSGPSTLVMGENSHRGKADVSVSGSLELVEHPVSARSSEVSVPAEGMEGELKRRRFQRAKQVQRDEFDEWEEAYVRETEQRKIDEMFMREALLEARKAADTWEVPVGAVLVQDGKIIARGYNLVEELRDSTAHAEMICIREASNQLRTWRLAGTTLYVTLEPCPMCAGAILQARVDTLVWGAPNKLLGADGSWIRLFPNGGGSGSELVDKPPAPVHPFHPNMKIRRGILSSECADVMQQFFQLRRRKKEKNVDPPPKPSLPISTHHSKILHKMHNIFHALLCL